MLGKRLIISIKKEDCATCSAVVPSYSTWVLNMQCVYEINVLMQCTGEIEELLTVAIQFNN